MLKKRSQFKDWIPVKTASGRTGYYEVSEGVITVKFEGRTKVTSASGAGDNEGLARLILSERWTDA